MKKILIFIGLCLTTLLAFDQYEPSPKVSVGSLEFRYNLPFIDALERQLYDIRVRLSARQGEHNTVIIIDVDEPSLLAEGQWPWPRAKLARLVDALFDNYGVSTLGFDAVFAEPEDAYTLSEIQQAMSTEEPSSGKQFTAPQAVNRLKQLSGDRRMAQSFADRSVVLGYVFESSAGEHTAQSVGQLPEPMFGFSEFPIERINQETLAQQASRFSANIPLLQEAATTAGFFSILELDPDGVIRRVELLNKFDGQIYGSLSLKLVQSFFMDEPEAVIVGSLDDNNYGLEAISMLLMESPLEIDSSASVYVPYATAIDGFKYISAKDILNGSYSGDISGTIAILGTSSQGLGDIRATPVAPGLPGVEVHANLVAGMLDQSFRVKPQWITGGNIMVVVVLGVILSLLFPFLSAAWSSVVFVLSMSATLWLNWFFWADQNYILALAPPLFLVCILFVVNTIAGFFLESNARRTTQKMFGLYVPPEVVGKMSANADIYSLKSEKKEMSVLFADIRDFTTISESMSPEDLSDWLNRFLTPMTQIIHQHGGAIDKYMGDAIMAFWGAPLDDPDHAQNSLKAAFAMIDHLDELNQSLRQESKPEIRIGIGINSGLVSVGNMGSEFRMAYTVVGDAVNLASRLEGLTKNYQVPIVVSEFTKALAPEVQYEHLDNVKVKGKNKSVTIYTCQSV